MDYQMGEDDPEGAAAGLNNQQATGRCPYRASTDGASGSASSQHNWTHNPHFHAGHNGGAAGMPMPYASYASPNAYWAGIPAGQQHPLAPRQPYASHQTRSSSSSTNSEYGAQENRSHGQAQVHNQHRQSLDENRPPMPRVFSSPDPRLSANANGQSAQNGAAQTPSSSSSSPTHNSAPNRQWSMNPYAMDSTGRPATFSPPIQFHPRPPPQFNLQQTAHGQHHPRQLPQPNLNSSGSAAAALYLAGYQGRNHQMSQNGQPVSPNTVQYYSAFGMPVTNIPAHVIEAQQRRHQAQTEAILAATAAQMDDSDDDSEADEDDDEDTDSSPPRTAYARTAGGRSFETAADREAYVRAQEAMVARERQRAARRAQLHNVKSIADPSYVAGLEKVDLETLTGDEITCMICYNDFGVKNPDGQIEPAVRLKKCKHILGENCLKKWFEDSDSCPYCRDKVPSIHKSRLSLARRAQEEIGGHGPTSRILARYAAVEAQRAGTGAPPMDYERQLHYAQYMEATLARAVGGTGELPRHYATRAQIEERIDELRGGEDRPDPRDEARERYQRMYQRRDDNAFAPSENYGVSMGGLYGTRAVPQAERRRQARVRTANRGAMNISAGSTANVANLIANAAAGQPAPYAGPVATRLSPTSPSAGRGSHSANSSWDSNSSGVGPRSITPHPTVLESFANESRTSPTLNPAAPVWNGTLLRQSQNNQQQPNGPPAPDSPSRALFGYYQNATHPGRARTGSMPNRPAFAFDQDPREVNPNNWRAFSPDSNNSGDVSNSGNGNQNTQNNANTDANTTHSHGNQNSGNNGNTDANTNAVDQAPNWNRLRGGAVGAVELASLYDFDGMGNADLGNDPGFGQMEQLSPLEQLSPMDHDAVMAGLNDEGF